MADININQPTLQVRNKDLINYLNPEKTYTGEALIAGADTTLVVRDNAGFSDNDYLGIGEPGIERSEINQIDGVVTLGTAITIANPVFSHPIDTPIYKLPGDKIEFFRAATLTGTKTSLSSSTPQVINYQDEYTSLVDSANTTGYFWIRIYSTEASGYVSDYIGGWNYEGLDVDTAGGIIEAGLLREGERGFTGLLTSEFLTNEVRLYRNFMKNKMNINTAISQDTSETVETNQWQYDLPSDLNDPTGDSSISSIVLGYHGPMEKVSYTKYQDEMKGIKHTQVATQAVATDTSLVLDDTAELNSPDSGSASIQINGNIITYTTNTKSTNTLSGIPATGTGAISETLTVDKDVWQDINEGLPSKYCVWDSVLYTLPICDSTNAGITMTINYFDSISTKLESTDALDVITELGIIWIQWRIREAKKDKTGAQAMETRFRRELKDYFGYNDVNVDSAFSLDEDNTYTI